MLWSPSMKSSCCIIGPVRCLGTNLSLHHSALIWSVLRIIILCMTASSSLKCLSYCDIAEKECCILCWKNGLVCSTWCSPVSMFYKWAWHISSCWLPWHTMAGYSSVCVWVQVWVTLCLVDVDVHWNPSGHKVNIAKQWHSKSACFFFYVVVF